MEDLPAPGMPTSTIGWSDAGSGAGGVATGGAGAARSGRARLRDTVAKVSTALPARGSALPMFRRPVLLVVLALFAVLVVGLLAIGAFPPSVAPQPVERPIPADRLGTAPR